MEKQETNWVAIGMFVAFVILTLGITKWAAAQTKSAAQFYSAGGGITGFQNGLAIAGDYMSAASFLGISGLVYLSGYDGLIYSVGFLVGWPIVTFLIAEPLRNLGKFTFADVASFRFGQTPIRILAACGTLVTVAFYLIAQMVGAGQLIKLLFGLDYAIAVVVVGVLMIVYVTFGGMVATTWVQIIKACLLLAGATFMAFMVLVAFRLQPRGPVRQGGGGSSQASGDHVARHAGDQSDLGGLARPGADVRHRRPAAHPDALLHRVQRQGRAQVGVLRHRLHRLFLHPDLHHRLRRHRASSRPIRPISPIAAKGLAAIKGGSNMAAIHLADAVGGNVFLGFISAVAFATILAVVSGLTLSGASAISHDLYATVIKRRHGQRTGRNPGLQDRDRRARRHRHHPRHRLREAERRLHGRPRLLDRRLVQLPGPADVAYVARHDHARRGHRRLPGPHHRAGRRGVLAGGLGSRASAIPKGSAPFPYSNPALFSMTIAFVGIWLFSKLDTVGAAPSRTGPASTRNTCARRPASAPRALPPTNALGRGLHRSRPFSRILRK